ncbi:MAG: hypothetical protein J6P94_05065 [Oscillospiraceae bacterium]|nr:hypothetical protein [Oscillospiraceae bacterium]
MSLEAIQLISEAEERSRKMKSECSAAAKKRVADAHTKGKALLEQAERTAEAELEALYNAATKEAESAAGKRIEEGKATEESMRALAGQRMEEAVSFIVERIVND